MLGDVRERGGGMPSFEHEDGGFVVFELEVAQGQGRLDTPLMLFPRWYGAICLLAPDGPGPVHHMPSQLWCWRPMIYRMNVRGGWTGLGSQEELAWRHGLDWMQRQVHRVEAGELTREEAVGLYTMEDADNRADALLEEFLTPQQVLEFRLAQGFRVRGAKTGDYYAIEIGNGFAKIDPITLEMVVSYCFHPEEWIPHADVALATKLALEDEELEEEFLEAAREQVVPPEWLAPARWEDLKAAEIEKSAALLG